MQQQTEALNPIDNHDGNRFDRRGWTQPNEQEQKSIAITAQQRESSRRNHETTTKDLEYQAATRFRIRKKGFQNEHKQRTQLR